MIKFSCKKISKEDLIKCAFALNKTEYNLLMFLLKKDRNFTAIQISTLMKLDRTTIQKAIKKLVDKELVDRKQKNVPGGGYTFLYLIEDKKEIKNKIKDVIHKWCKSVEDVINEV